MNLLSLGAGFDIADFCTQMQDVVQIIGCILLVFKIAIPLLIIALGIFDFGKAVVAEKEDEIKKQTKRLLYRVVAGIVIFFIPTLVTWIFKAFVPDYETDAESFKTCEDCFLHPNSKCNVTIHSQKY